MTHNQLPLDLPARIAMGRGDFFEAPCNAAALAQIDGWAAWPLHRLLLTGAPGSGRTHLAHVFAELTGGAVIAPGALLDGPPDAALPALALDDADSLAGDPEAETRLFHLVNHCTATGLPLLLTARDTPGTWGLTLPDLESRLSASPTVRLAAPDDALLTMVLAKLFDDRQLQPGLETLKFLAARMGRTLTEASRIVAEIDRAALAQRRAVTRPLAAQVLANYVNDPK